MKQKYRNILGAIMIVIGLIFLYRNLQGNDSSSENNEDSHKKAHTVRIIE